MRAWEFALRWESSTAFRIPFLSKCAHSLQDEENGFLRDYDLSRDGSSSSAFDLCSLNVIVLAKATKRIMEL